MNNDVTQTDAMTAGESRTRVILRRVRGVAPWVYVAAGGIILLIVALPAVLDRPTFRAYLAADAWETGDAFYQSPEPHARRLPDTILTSPDRRLWVNYSSTTGVREGELKSQLFKLRSRELLLPVLGYPNSAFAGVYVESEHGRRFPVGPGASHEHWELYRARLPPSLVGERVRVVAYSTSKDAYIGAGTPFYRADWPPPGLELSKLAGSAALSVVYALVIFLPALLLVRRLSRAGGANAALRALVAVSLLMLTLFYVGYLWPGFGRWCCRAWLVASAALLVHSASTGKLRLHRSDRLAFALLVGITTFQSLFVFSFNLVSDQYAANYLFSPASWSTDNQIPATLAQLLANGSVTTEWAFGSWKVSDRTPLLSALLYPAAVLLRDCRSELTAGGESVILQMCSFGIQNSWVLPAVAIWRRFRMDSRQCAAAAVLVACTPFVFYNTVYAWPKILSATFCLIQCVFLLPVLNRSDRQRIHGAPILAGAAASLAILSHSASAVAVAAIFAVAVLLGSRRTLIRICYAGACTAIIVATWVLWVRVNAPTTNPLPKFWLTGEFDFTGSKGSVLHAVIETYRATAFDSWLRTKFGAIRTLIGVDREQARAALGLFSDPFAGWRALRAYQFFFLLPALGLLLVPLGLLLSRLDRIAPRRFAADMLVRLSLLAAGLTVAVQLLVMLAPHWLHHYPYFVPLALHVLAIGVAVKVRCLIMRLAVLLTFVLFVIYWIGDVVVRTPVGSAAGLACALLIAFGGLVSVGLLFRRTDRPQRRV